MAASLNVDKSISDYPVNARLLSCLPNRSPTFWSDLFLCAARTQAPSGRFTCLIKKVSMSSSTSTATELLAFGLISVLAGCYSSPAPERKQSAPKIALRPDQPSESSASEDCGLAEYPASRSNQEILAGVPHESKTPHNSEMLAKITIDKDGKITHIRVLQLAHSNAPNWKEINDSALNDIKRWHYKPTFYQGKPVAVCTDVDVTIDLF